MQATKGTNTELRPSCIITFFSGTTNADKKWQIWKNLGLMSKEDACTKFLGEIMHINPDFMNHVIEPESMSIRGLMQYHAAQKIQGMFRSNRSMKRVVRMIAKTRANDLQLFIGMLVKGIRVLKLRSDGGAAKKRYLALKMGNSLADSRLYTFTEGYSPDSSAKGAYLVDIADVRLGAKSFLFVPVASSLKDYECMSIICSERTFDLQIVEGSTSRNWLACMLLLLLESVISIKDATGRGRLRGRRLLSSKTTIPAGIMEDAKKLSVLIEKGIGVEEFFNGAAHSKSLWLSKARRRIYIGKSVYFR